MMCLLCLRQMGVLTQVGQQRYLVNDKVSSPEESVNVTLKNNNYEQPRQCTILPTAGSVHLSAAT